MQKSSFSLETFRLCAIEKAGQNNFEKIGALRLLIRARMFVFCENYRAFLAALELYKNGRQTIYLSEICKTTVQMFLHIFGFVNVLLGD